MEVKETKVKVEAPQKKKSQRKIKEVKDNHIESEAASLMYPKAKISFCNKFLVVQ